MMGNNGQQNQNIFGQNQTQGSSSSNQDVASDSANVKTDTSGDIGNASPSSVAGGQPPKVTASATQQNLQNNQKAISSNVGKTQKPAALNTLQNEIDTTKQGLQQKAADYATQQQQKQNYTVDNSTLDKAIGGDSASAAKAQDLLSRTTYNPIDSFDYGDVSVKDANLLNNNAGIQQLVTRGQSPTYNKNMAAFDAMLLQMDPNFQNQVSSIKKQTNDIQSLADTTKTNAESAANTMAQNNLNQAQQSAKDYLTGQENNILAQNKAAADKYNTSIANLDKSAISNQALAAAKAQAQADLDKMYGAGRSSAQLNNINVDPTQFFSAASQMNPDQFYTADSAQKYNTIAQLLGQGGAAAVAGNTPGPLYNIDQTGLYNSIFAPASQARQQQDIQDQSKIQDILAAAQKSADQNYQDRLKTVSSQSGQAPVAGIITNYLNGGNANIDSYYRNNPDAFVNAISNFESQYAQQNPLNPGGVLSANDVLNQDQVNQLNSLMLDLKGAGNYNPYQVSQFAGGMPTPAYDPNAVQAAFKDFLAGNIPTSPSAASAPVSTPVPMSPAQQVSSQAGTPINSTGAISAGADALAKNGNQTSQTGSPIDIQNIYNKLAAGTNSLSKSGSKITSLGF